MTNVGVSSVFKCWFKGRTVTNTLSPRVSPLCQMWLQLKIKWSSLRGRNRASLRRWWRRRRSRRSRGQSDLLMLPWHDMWHVVCMLLQTHRHLLLSVCVLSSFACMKTKSSWSEALILWSEAPPQLHDTFSTMCVNYDWRILRTPVFYPHNRVSRA